MSLARQKRLALFFSRSQLFFPSFSLLSLSNNQNTQRPLVSVVRKTAASSSSSSSSSSSLSAGDVVLCRVTRISQRAAFATIVCVERSSSSSSDSSPSPSSTTATAAVPLATPLTGILRAPDVRATEIDAVEVPACFRPGDVVRARVLSLGDSRSFHLSTAADDLGVVFARSEAAGAPLVAESWERMRCPSTGTVEKRKVAKQQQQQQEQQQ